MNQDVSRIKKDVVMRDFRMQIRGKSSSLVKQFDTPFFRTINSVFRKKPQNVVFHIVKDMALTFNIEFDDVSVFLEHFPQSIPTTLLKISTEDIDFMECGDLESCLGIIDESVTIS